MTVIILDDDIVSGLTKQRPPVLPSGYNRMEEHYHYFVDQQVPVLLFDGRVPTASGGWMPLGDAAQFVDELERRLAAQVVPRNEQNRYDLRVSLDMEWFQDREGGNKILRELAWRKPIFELQRVVICSKYRDNEMKFRASQWHGVQTRYVVDKSATDTRTLFRLLME